ncbi:ArsA family ATPase [Actinotalea sp. K2]|uniref:ArsA family ATPase n=1 Tax=Actinotalea sp. K2 TaxID=2939438 RepID=UPI00201717A1|nr:ArsA family ATPase [Actinotalea sp. K2]MCL3862454.1 ArsA family ATPase [Actinotalea sp. K2]
MLLELAASRRVLVVGGKGGVGKTAVASALALSQARRGRRVLLVSTDPAHNLGHLWQQVVGDRGSALAPDLDGVEVDPVETTRAHLTAVGETMRRLMPEHLAGEVDRHLAQAQDAPGMHEAAILERVAETLDEATDSYDLCVVDTAPSGHTTRLLGLPASLSTWTEGLLRRQDRAQRFTTAEHNLGEPRAEPSRAARDQEIRRVLQRRLDRFDRLRATLVDHAGTAFVVVLAAERLPVLETVELTRELRRTGVDVAAAVVNKRSPADAGAFLAGRRVQEEVHLRTLRAELPDLATIEVPLLAEDVLGHDALVRFAAHLGGPPGPAG